MYILLVFELLGVTCLEENTQCTIFKDAVWYLSKLKFLKLYHI